MNFLFKKHSMSLQFNQGDKTFSFIVERKYHGKVGMDVYTRVPNDQENIFGYIAVFDDDMVLVESTLGNILIPDYLCKRFRDQYETDNMLDIVLSHYRDIYKNF